MYLATVRGLGQLLSGRDRRLNNRFQTRLLGGKRWLQELCVQGDIRPFLPRDLTASPDPRKTHCNLLSGL